MTDFTNTFGGAAKDAANDTVLGAQMDTQFDNIGTHSATKANKVTTPTADNILSMDANGDLKDSGVAIGGVDSTELAILDGATLTTTEINYVDGVTSNIQDQLNSIPQLTILDIPELIYNSTVDGSWTTIDSATLNTAEAIFAIVKVVGTQFELSSTSTNVVCYLRKTSSGLSADDTTLVASASGERSSNGVINTTAIGEATIKLDGSFDFDIQISSSGTLDGGKVYLIGYQS